jgi:hypothetical protein
MFLAMAGKTRLGLVTLAQRLGVQGEIAEENGFVKFLQQVSGG